MQNTYIPFHQKYRPKNLDELVGQEFISITLKQALVTKKIAPAYLFNGPRGTGKTSSARIFAKSLNCLSFDYPTADPCGECELCKQISDGNALDIIEIDAASNTGVENIREIIEKARFAPSQARWKVYVIDECHMLSTAASNALLKTIEEPPSQVVFILATTNPERVLSTIQSRCQKFDFRRINSNDIFRHLSQIANKESINFQDQALKLIAKRSNGGMRDAQSLLDQLSLLPEGITIKNVQNVLGEVSEIDLINLVNSLIENNPESLLFNCNKLFDAGNEPKQIIVGLLNITRDLLLNSKNNQYSDIFYTPFEFKNELDKFSNKLDNKKIINWHNNLKNVEYQIKTSDNPRLWLEIHLTSLLENKKEENITNKQNNYQKNDSNQRLQKHSRSENRNSQELHDAENITNNINKNNSGSLDDHESDFNSKEISKDVRDVEDINKLNNENDLNAKWDLILSKLELPSTKMLLSQQAELQDFNANEVVIALSPNWENMIKSRKIVIENAVKKIFGNQIKLIFSSKKLNEMKTNKTIEKKRNVQNPLKINETDSNKPNYSKEVGQNKINDNSSENLANFFNGEIIDLDQ